VASSHSITSHAKHPKNEIKYISFEYMHPEASINEYLEIVKPTQSQGSKQRKVASH
jgi:hypothetical protein